MARVKNNNRATNVAKEYIKDMDKNKVASIILLLFLVVFLFNLLKFNRKVPVGNDEIEKNKKSVEALQKSSVTSVEEAVSALGGEVSANGQSNKARYMSKFKGSIVVGDSVTEGLSVYGWLSDDQVFSKIGSSVMTGDDLFSSAAGTYPSTAFFAFGMNDMGNYRGDEKAFIKKYEARLKAFHKASPKTKICVCGISAPTDSAMAKNKSISNYKKFNSAIKKMCAKNKYVYIPTADILQKHPELYAGDGIHAQATYYPYWLDRMIEEAEL